MAFVCDYHGLRSGQDYCTLCYPPKGSEGLPVASRCDAGYTNGRFESVKEDENPLDADAALKDEHHCRVEYGRTDARMTPFQ